MTIIAGDYAVSETYKSKIDMRIAILNYEHAVPASVEGPGEIWFCLKRFGKVNLDIDIVEVRKSGAVARPFDDAVFTKVEDTTMYDLIIVPAMRASRIDEVLTADLEAVAWLRDHHARGAVLASICIGAFLLAATGLLTGKQVTTNLVWTEKFRARFPEVELAPESVIVDQGSLCSCGGAFTFTTLMLYLIEKFFSREKSILVAKILVINVHNTVQTPFSIFQLQHAHGDSQILKAQHYIENNYRSPLTVDDLAAACSMSRRNFVRRFYKATNNTPVEYLQRVRMEAAKKMLEAGNHAIEQVAYACGYGDLAFFRNIFKRHTTMTPRGYQLKFGIRVRATQGKSELVES